MATNTNDNLPVKLAFCRDGDKYICFICKGLMVKPCQTVNCGHHFCKCCLEQLYDEGDTKVAICPKSECGKPLRGPDGTKYFPDRCIEREISSLHVLCPLSESCKWTGEYKQLKEHQQKDHCSSSDKPTTARNRRPTHVQVGIKEDKSKHHMTKDQQVPAGRESQGDEEQCGAQSTSSLGRADQPNFHDHSNTLKALRPSVLLMDETEPESDTGNLTQSYEGTSPGDQQALVVGVDLPLRNAASACPRPRRRISPPSSDHGANEGSAHTTMEDRSAIGQSSSCSRIECKQAKQKCQTLTNILQRELLLEKKPSKKKILKRHATV